MLDIFAMVGCSDRARTYEPSIAPYQPMHSLRGAGQHTFIMLLSQLRTMAMPQMSMINDSHLDGRSFFRATLLGS